MKVRGSVSPSAAFSIEQQPNRPGYILARFYENVRPYAGQLDERPLTGFEYDEYTLELMATDTIEADIADQYDMYLNQAKLEDPSRPTETDLLRADVEEMAPGVAVAALAFVVLAEGGQIDDVTAAEHAEQFERWVPDVAYKAGAIRSHEGVLYRCVQAHDSQAGWEPPGAASLWAKIADPSEEWPSWSQPIGAHDAYSAGDKVSHGGKRWISDADGNVWEPGVYGWSEAAQDGEE